MRNVLLVYFSVSFQLAMPDKIYQIESNNPGEKIKLQNILLSLSLVILSFVKIVNENLSICS